MGTHWPSCSGWLQATQAPVQATLQQTPSLQNPDWQSASSSQAAPRGLSVAQAAPAQQTRPTHMAVAHSKSQTQGCPAALGELDG
jgi:hypothetical protein